MKYQNPTSLNQLLASIQIHYQKLRQFHWNIEGANFFELHDKFEELYILQAKTIDTLAERIMSIGEKPLSNFSQYLRYSTIHEIGEELNDIEMVEEVVSDMKIIIEQIKMNIQESKKKEDIGTSHILLEYLVELEKKNWMLTTWMKGQSIHIEMELAN